MRLKSVIIFGVLLFSSVAMADGEQLAGLKASSAWTNQSGSTLYIDSIDDRGFLTGTYINRASGYSCQNISYPVVGWVYGTAITFNTIWRSTTESCNSITAWTGFLYNGKIDTLWQLTRNGSSNTSQIIKGNDVFSPSAAIEKKSLMLN